MYAIFSKINLGTDYEYYSLPLWVAGTTYDNNFFQVAILGQNELDQIKYIKNEYKEFKDFRTDTGFNYLIITQSGALIASYFNGKFIEYYIDLDVAFKKTSPDLNAYLKVAIPFLKDNFGIDDSNYHQLYKISYEEMNKKLNIFIPAYEEISRLLIEKLTKYPSLIQNLHWRQFEELLAELFSQFGYETEIGPGSGDDGVDLRLIKHSDFGSMLMLVQAKRYSSHKSIGLQPVQALYGAVNDEKASKGIVVATCEFAPVAKRFENKNPYKIQLAGTRELEGWLKKYCET